MGQIEWDKQGQEMFFNFILERVQEGKEAEAKEILTENFKKQDEDTFSQEDIQQFIPKMISLLKPEKSEKFKAVAIKFSEITLSTTIYPWTPFLRMSRYNPTHFQPLLGYCL